MTTEKGIIEVKKRFDLAKVIYAIVRSVSCERCPYDCGSEPYSIETCSKRWYQILTNLDTKPSEKETLAKMYYEDYKQNFPKYKGEYPK